MKLSRETNVVPKEVPVPTPVLAMVTCASTTLPDVCEVAAKMTLAGGRAPVGNVKRVDVGVMTPRSLTYPSSSTQY